MVWNTGLDEFCNPPICCQNLSLFLILADWNYLSKVVNYCCNYTVITTHNTVVTVLLKLLMHNSSATALENNKPTAGRSLVSWASGVFISCPLQFFPCYSFLFVFYFLFLISSLLSPCTVVGAKTHAWVPHFW